MVKKITGIYKIINKINFHYYVGSSSSIINRWYYHKRKLNKNIHENQHLQNAWNKYGKDNFNFFITETCLVNNVLTLEQKYLDIAKSEKNVCYNMNYNAYKTEITDEIRSKISKKAKLRFKHKKNHPFYGKRHTEETKEKIRNSNCVKSGVSHGNADKNFYNLKNNLTGQTFCGYRYDFIKNNNLNKIQTEVGKLFKRKIISLRGWVLS